MGLLFAFLAGAALLFSGGSAGSSPSPSNVPKPTPDPGPLPKLTGPFELRPVEGGVLVVFDGPRSIYDWLNEVVRQLGISDDTQASAALVQIAARVTEAPIVGIKILSMGPNGADEWEGEGGIVEGTKVYTVGEARVKAQAWLAERSM